MIPCALINLPKLIFRWALQHTASDIENTDFGINYQRYTVSQKIQYKTAHLVSSRQALLSSSLFKRQGLFIPYDLGEAIEILKAFCIQVWYNEVVRSQTTVHGPQGFHKLDMVCIMWSMKYVLGVVRFCIYNREKWFQISVIAGCHSCLLFYNKLQLQLYLPPPCATLKEKRRA